MFPTAELRVYVVWFNMLPSDRREEWDARLMPDSRVTHYWDEGRLVGNWYGSQDGCADCIVWDIYYLYGPGAELSEWEESGYTVFGKRDQLLETITPMLSNGETIQ